MNLTLNRPTTFIPYGPLGHPAAKFFFDAESETENLAAFRFYHPQKPRIGNEIREDFAKLTRNALALNGFFILEVQDGKISAEQAAKMTMPARFVPALPGAPGRKVEHFKHTVPGYFQHYTYEPFTSGSPDCDHDFGVESAAYVFKVTETGEQLSMAELRSNPSMADRGHIYLTVKCTRCGDVHGIKQITCSGKTEFMPNDGSTKPLLTLA